MGYQGCIAGVLLDYPLQRCRHHAWLTPAGIARNRDPRNILNLTATLIV